MQAGNSRFEGVGVEYMCCPVQLFPFFVRVCSSESELNSKPGAVARELLVSVLFICANHKHLSAD